MQNNFRFTAIAAFLLIAGFSCKKSSSTAEEINAVTPAVINSIKEMGFNINNISAAEGGYIVEGDIFIPTSDLSRRMQGNILRVGQSEQYRTTNLVTGLPRNITILVATSLPASYISATDEAITRYNAQNLQITLTRITSGTPSITIKAAPKNAQYLASAGFPTSTGNPYNTVLVSTRQIGSQPLNTVASILAHEIGHCIGFRHTDYMDRSYSCGGGTANEGASTVGAIQVPGTPAGPDPNSWMLACIGSGQNRPFNNNDKTALNYLY